MEWNVFYHPFDKNKIELYNVFDHPGFRKDVMGAFAKYENKDEFADRVSKDLFHYFGFKCEWETVIGPFISRHEFCVKVDVYQQIKWNWGRFIDYLWDQRGSK